MTANPVIVWFRHDLRLADNPALTHALASGRPVLPVFVLDDEGRTRRIGAASRWWLDKSLRALNAALEDRGSRLILRSGDSLTQIRRLADETGADLVFMNRMFEPDAFARDAEVAHALKADEIECRGFNGSLLCRPGSVLNGSGQPYKVFTPFLKALLGKVEALPECPVPAQIVTPATPGSEAIDDWRLHPSRPDWSGQFRWTPGEVGAGRALTQFLAQGLKTYSTGRNLPAVEGVSRLSPHLAWGEIHPLRVLQRARQAAAEGRVPPSEADKFIAELGWRDFSAQLVHHFPHMTDRAFRPEYDAMPWREDPKGLRAWQRGLTGFPIVDAGMRQLWATGWMHNRVRMVVASFLVKDLLVDWRAGEAWFWDTLVDADLGNNVQNWQWTAGSGADAAPYFRVFNPVSQGQKFDAKGQYVRRWIPEIAALPDKWIHAPWTAPHEDLVRARLRLGTDYPHPIVDHAMARDRALDSLKVVTAHARRMAEMSGGD